MDIKCKVDIYRGLMVLMKMVKQVTHLQVQPHLGILEFSGGMRQQIIAPVGSLSVGLRPKPVLPVTKQHVQKISGTPSAHNSI